MREPTSLDKFIMNIINRYGWLRWPAKQAVLNRCKQIIYIGKRKRVYFTCEKCGKKNLTSKDVEVDHIEPRINPEKGFEGIEEFVLRTFVGTDKLQLLCKECHDEKSELENQIRRKVREEENTSIPRDKRRVKTPTKRNAKDRAKLARK